MEYNTCTLSTGLRVIHLPLASEVVYCGYAIAAGSRHEEPGKEGMAHFCEHASFKGTAKHSAFQLINSLEIVGGETNAFTNKEYTVYYASVLKAHLPRAVDLLSDLVFRSVYPQNELEKEAEVICDEIESYNDSPSELIYDDFENLLFKGHPLGHNILGTAQNVRAFTRTDALAFTQKHYLPANAVFFAYGDVPFARLVKLLEKATLGVPSAEPCPLLPLRMPLPPLQEGLFKTIEKPTHQAHVMMGCRTFGADDPRRMALYLLNNMLGGPGMNARLSLSLREKRGLVYTVESSMVCYADTGLWSVYFGCDPHDVPQCLRLVRSELRKLSQKALSPAAIRRAKRQLKGQIGVACDNNESFALDFSRVYLQSGKAKKVADTYAKIDALTPEELLAVAREMLDPDRMCTLLYAPSAQTLG